MWWRIREGERFMDVHGNEAKRRQKELVLAERSRGLIAFAGGEPVGWCAYGRRTEFAVLAGANEREIAESIAMAAIVRHWSTLLNGLEIDEVGYRKDIDRLVRGAKKLASAPR